MTAPTDLQEQCFCHEISTGKIRIVSKTLKKSIEFLYDNKYLPYLTEWKCMAAGDYVLGIEPSTSSFIGERRYVKINADEQIEIKFKISVKDKN